MLLHELRSHRYSPFVHIISCSTVCLLPASMSRHISDAHRVRASDGKVRSWCWASATYVTARGPCQHEAAEFLSVWWATTRFGSGQFTSCMDRPGLYHAAVDPENKGHSGEAASR